MRSARVRALPHPFCLNKPEWSDKRRNEVRPRKGIATVLVHSCSSKANVSRNEVRPYKGIFISLLPNVFDFWIIFLTIKYGLLEAAALIKTNSNFEMGFPFRLLSRQFFYELMNHDKSTRHLRHDPMKNMWIRSVMIRDGCW